MAKRIQRRVVLVLSLIAAAAAIGTGVLCLGPSPAASPRGHAPVRLAGEEIPRLDLNEADAPELECLPGIGPVLARAILDRRAELGAFRSEEDILSVPGVGPATYEKIAPFITWEARRDP